MSSKDTFFLEFISSPKNVCAKQSLLSSCYVPNKSSKVSFPERFFVAQSCRLFVFQ